jgi:hypothetical protein
MATFYSNENFPLPVVDELRKLGHDVWTIQEAGKANQAMPDEACVDFCFSSRPHFVNLESQTLY